MKPIAPNERMASWLERAWLNRYLDRKLDDDEVEWFEMYALDKPELIATIDADSDLRDGFALAADTTSTAATPIRRVGKAAHPHRRMGPTLAWAASAIACVGLGWIMALQFLPALPGAEPGIVASPTRIVFDTLRGVEDAPQVFPGAPDSEWAFVEVGVPTDVEQVVLRVSNSATAQTLRVSSDGFAGFLVPMTNSGDATVYTIEYSSAGSNHVRVFSLPGLERRRQ